MATFYADGYGAALGAGASAGSAPDLSSPALLNGKLRIASFVYSIVTTEAVGDTIKVARLPKGARIWFTYLGCEDCSATAASRITLQMGSTAISATIDPNNAVATALHITAITGVTNAQGVVVTSGNEEIAIVVSGSQALLNGTAAKKMWGSIWYSVE